ncbi:phosphotransferase family protein [Metabacillus arenae]|uniref:Phosphotransferase family protein n=1 Tax=Metabacillus arenae TaxID=2771434 RepID=A0A926N9U3_9BACI|nr:phosphotransferase family protein [Metabacillus arenae]MBD1380182.1 phosphotransferase family protein [Metabacillus arenae]
MKLKVNWLEQLLGSDWEVYPAGGSTGDAYFAQIESQKLFLKRNSSPFLAVLSAEGIVPKLIWTKRMENGDVITAQHCLNGRELKPADMKDEHVAALLHKIHHSKELLDMLKRLGKQPLTPNSILEDLKQTIIFEQINVPEIKQAIVYLENQLEHVQYEEKVVCHCDVNHNNWLLSDSNQLYLIDWDGAMIADPAIDIGVLLYWYIDKEDWEQWLNQYGLEFTEHLQRRMYWYVMAQTLTLILWNRTRNNLKDMNIGLTFLHGLLNNKCS